MCLITQASLAAVFRYSAISSILTPIRDVAVKFYGATSAMWKDKHHIRAAQVDYLRACQIIEFCFEDLLWDSEEFLIEELQDLPLAG